MDDQLSTAYRSYLNDLETRLTQADPTSQWYGASDQTPGFLDELSRIVGQDVEREDVARAVGGAALSIIDSRRFQAFSTTAQAHNTSVPSGWTSGEANDAPLLSEHRIRDAPEYPEIPEASLGTAEVSSPTAAMDVQFRRQILSLVDQLPDSDCPQPTSHLRDALMTSIRNAFRLYPWTSGDDSIIDFVREMHAIVDLSGVPEVASIINPSSTTFSEPQTIQMDEMPQLQGSDPLHESGQADTRQGSNMTPMYAQDPALTNDPQPTEQNNDGMEEISCQRDAEKQHTTNQSGSIDYGVLQKHFKLGESCEGWVHECDRCGHLERQRRDFNRHQYSRNTARSGFGLDREPCYTKNSADEYFWHGSNKSGARFSGRLLEHEGKLPRSSAPPPCDTVVPEYIEKKEKKRMEKSMAATQDDGNKKDDAEGMEQKDGNPGDESREEGEEEDDDVGKDGSHQDSDSTDKNDPNVEINKEATQ